MDFFKRDSLGRRLTPDDAGFKDAVYTVYFELNKKRFTRSTKRTVLDGKDGARKEGDRLYAKALGQSLGAPADAPKAPAAVVLPTINQFCGAYPVAPTEAKAKTRRDTLAVLRKMLKVGYPDCKDVGLLRIDCINADLADAWFNHYLLLNSRLEQDQVQQMHNRNTANSEMGKVRALFHDGIMDHHKKVSMFSVTFEEFRKKGKARRFKKNVVNGIKAYTPPDMKVIDDTLVSWLKLEDRNVFIAAGFALAFGLRKGETQQVKWGWLRLLHTGSPGLSNAADVANVKDGTGTLTVRALDPYYSQFMARLDEMGWRGEADELVLIGGAAELKNECYDRLGKWLTAMGWNTDKKSHALRAFAGSKVCMRYDLGQAKIFLRHKRYVTTELHYSYFMDHWPMTTEEREAMPERFAPKVATNILPLPLAAAA